MGLSQTSVKIFRPSLVLTTAGLLAALGWVYWNTLTPLFRVWTVSAQYSHGYLVPVFALALLFLRRSQLAGKALEASWWAIPFVLAGVALRLLGAYFYLTWLDQVSLLPVVAALVLVAGGRPALIWAWPAIAFLLFMIPLPGRLEGFLADPLQRLATIGSTNVLQTLGFFAQSDGNVILLSDGEALGVVDACKGLNMLVVFLALSTGVAILSTRPWYYRCLILAGSIPIALMCNILRIALTGILTETAGPEVAQFVFHGWPSGWLMIVLALAFMSLELWILSRLFVARKEAGGGLMGPEQFSPIARTAGGQPTRLNGHTGGSAGALAAESVK
jgi:exosortase